jgi:hypothetical protein
MRTCGSTLLDRNVCLCGPFPPSCNFCKSRCLFVFVGVEGEIGGVMPDLVVVEVLVVSEVDEGVLVGPVVDSQLMVGARTCTR